MSIDIELEAALLRENPLSLGSPTPAMERSAAGKRLLSQPDGRTLVKIVVDLNRCQGYGQCVYAAPSVFQLKGVEILAYDPAPSDQWRDEVEHAVHACPVRAISAQFDSSPVEPAATE
jgi:ferredoxin